MKNYLLIPLLLSIIVIIILIIVTNKKQKTLNRVILEKHEIEVLKKGELKDYFEEEWKKEKQKIDYERQVHEGNITNQINQLENKYKLDASKYEGQIKQLDVKLQEKEKRYNEVNQDLNLYREGKIKEIDSTAAEYEQRKRTEINQALEQQRLQANSDFNNQVDSYIAQKAQMQIEIDQIKAELEVERSRHAAINEEIRRQKEVEMKQDFYRIQFNEEDKNDVEILRSIAPRLRHPEAINKVIWSAYYQKPLTELRKRLLPNGDKSGIYKITRLKTGEIYIGSTTSFDTRFVNHYKTALGVGTLASSQLHRTMREDGPEHFTVEILEEDIPKDKLKERESYYIDFYDSKNYGLNTIRGEQK